MDNNSQYDMIIGPFIATQERLRLVDMLQLPSEPINLLYRPRGRQITLAQGAVALLRVFRLELWLAYLFAMDFVRKCFFNYMQLSYGGTVLPYTSSALRCWR